MRTRRSGIIVSAIVAVIVTVLGCGRGLPGILHGIVGARHECTCASGGTHAACPVCNPSLSRERRSRTPAIDGLPCGEKRLVVEAAADPLFLATPRPTQIASWVRTFLPLLLVTSPGEVFVERRARPPRSAFPV
jgi:hypothetical protein